jgi:hypothetical protein
MLFLDLAGDAGALNVLMLRVAQGSYYLIVWSVGKSVTLLRRVAEKTER